MTTAMTAVPNADIHLDNSAGLFAAITTSQHSFLQPTSSLHTAAVLAAKRLLDPLANEVAESQIKRRNENRKKRKRGESESDGQDYVLQLRQIHTSGFGMDQIWEQGKRILEAAEAEIGADLDRLEAPGLNEAPNINGIEANDFDELSDGIVSEVEGDDDDHQDLLEHEDHDNEDDLEQEMDGAIDGLDPEDEEEDQDDIKDESGAESIHRQETYTRDPNGLNDGFFSIDDFNKQSQFLEQQDFRGEDDNPSDEDEVDWDADPVAVPLKSANGGKSSDDRDGGSDEDGPTFGIADLNADSESEDEALQDGELDETMNGLINTNDVLYADFFEPPPKKPSKTKRMRALPKTQPPPQPHKQDDDEVEDDIQRAISDVRRDLFDSEEEISEDEDESGSDVERPTQKIKAKNMSTHEKQRAKIATEIRRLEAMNVSKRDWTLFGEARAADRPLNSLIEEDLEFERTGKPVPVITAEVSEALEELIKRRIIAREFDEVIRRRPDALSTAVDTRRGRVEVDDAKPQTGLAEVYEQEHLRSTDPNYTDARSKATKKQHEEIDRLWRSVSGELDLLSNLHFKPKRAEVEIRNVEDKPVIAMEDARPVGVGGEESRLAPQEIYKPGEAGKSRDEVVRKSGANVSKEEMSREEKLRRRRRDKERGKKAKGNRVMVGGVKPGKEGEGKKSRKDEQGNILAQLKRGGVRVIGKEGRMERIGKAKGGKGQIGVVGEGRGESGSSWKL